LAGRQKVLFWDIETSPTLAFIFSARTEYVSHDKITHETFLISWAAKWAGEKKVYGDVLSSGEALAQDDARIVHTLCELIREADVIVAHNGDRFDVQMLQNRLLLMGLEPLPPLRTIDTLKLVKSNFRLMSNKLDHLSNVLGFGRKIRTDFELWENCYRGRAEALKEMHKYNKHDVVLLEQVYDSIRPYVKGLPRLFDGVGAICPHCGSDHLQRRGLHRTNAGQFQRFQCQACLKWSRSRKSEKGKSDFVPVG
jgi:uncharacterized protein YprB with RNaseH-like and TPR domain